MLLFARESLVLSPVLSLVSSLSSSLQVAWLSVAFAPAAGRYRHRADPLELSLVKTLGSMPVRSSHKANVSTCLLLWPTRECSASYILVI